MHGSGGSDLWIIGSGGEAVTINAFYATNILHLAPFDCVLVPDVDGDVLENLGELLYTGRFSSLYSTTLSASPFVLSTSSKHAKLVKYLVQNLTASDADFLTSSASSQPGPTPQVVAVAAPLPADTIVYSGEVPAVLVGGDGPDPVPLNLEDVEVSACNIFSSETGLPVSLQEQEAFECTLCTFRDIRKSKLTRHMREKHGGDGKAEGKVRCAPDCSYEYWPERTWELKRHRAPGGKCTR